MGFEAVVRRQRYPHAGVDNHDVPVDVEGLADFLPQLARERRGVEPGRDIGLDDGEFVAAHASNGVALPHATLQPRRDLLEQFVPDRVSEGVVDGLEVVEIEIEDRERSPFGVANNSSAWRWNRVRFGRLVSAS